MAEAPTVPPTMATAVHRQFVSEPMRDKLVTEVAGVGPANGKQLMQKGIVKASQLFAIFIELERNTHGLPPNIHGLPQMGFIDVLKEVYRFQNAYANECYNCLEAYYNRHDTNII